MTDNDHLPEDCALCTQGEPMIHNLEPLSWGDVADQGDPCTVCACPRMFADMYGCGAEGHVFEDDES